MALVEFPVLVSRDAEPEKGGTMCYCDADMSRFCCAVAGLGIELVDACVFLIPDWFKLDIHN